jgi:hypothetical protein
MVAAEAYTNLCAKAPRKNMKRIDKNELYRTLRGFLKSKGITLEDGTYTQRIRHGCGLLTDTINATQSTVTRAKGTVDKKLDQFRQSIHEATAPKPAPAGPAPKSPAVNQAGQVKGKPGAGAQPSANRARARRRK